MSESLFNKVAGLSPATLLKKRPCHRCFLVNVVGFLNFLLNDVRETDLSEAAIGGVL